MTIKMWGEDVRLMVTPRLCLYDGRENASLSFSGDGASELAEGGFGFSYGADVLYCAALNWWDLTGKDMDAFPYHRVDFHRWAFERPRDYSKAVNAAMSALSTGDKDENDGEEVKKK